MHPLPDAEFAEEQREREWGVGSGEWEVGSGEWGVGSGEWGVGSCTHQVVSSVLEVE